MAEEKKEQRVVKIATATECSHCHSYVAEHHVTSEIGEEDLCGNCVLTTSDQRSVEKRFAARLAEGRKKADDAAKRAYIEEMRKLNSEAVDEVMGGERSERIKVEGDK